MKVVIAPDKFKGSLSAPQVAQAIATGLQATDPTVQIDQCPVADGGEGTVAALVSATGGRLEMRRVTGPLPHIKVDATLGILGDGQTAVIEMAAASGLALLDEADRNPLNTTTFGTGQLLVAAAELGIQQIILGIGGSATVDGGVGCLQACGLPIILEGGEPTSPTEPLCGRDLNSVVLIKHGRGSPVERVRIIVACDVDNPLTGPRGAAAVFGPQKGATPAQVQWLDQALVHLSHTTGTMPQAQTPGAGAAGGLGFAMLAFLGAQLRSGSQIVLETARLRQRLAGVDLCITGEGQLDASSLHGKAPIAVARLCKELGVPCVAIVGAVGQGADLARGEGLTDYFALVQGLVTAQQAITQAPHLIQQAAEQLMRRLKSGWRPNRFTRAEQPPIA